MLVEDGSAQWRAAAGSVVGEWLQQSYNAIEALDQGKR